jgi:hypothetical protein
MEDEADARFHDTKGGARASPDIITRPGLVVACSALPHRLKQTSCTSPSSLGFFRLSLAGERVHAAGADQTSGGRSSTTVLAASLRRENNEQDPI